ncbi:MAG: hypothetical protein ACYCX9_11195 [Candidatus Dormibacteria bacterium]
MSATREGPVPGRGGFDWRVPALVVAVLVAILVGLVASVAAVAGVAAGVRAVAPPGVSAATSSATRHGVTRVSMAILVNGPPGWPRYTNPTWTVHTGQTVVLTITSYDDGAAPLTGAQTMFARVEGTLGGVEAVDGKLVHAVANQDVAHTFTVDGLGLNLPIPAAPTGGSVTVVARFVVTRAGSFVWQCYAPCGTGPNSMGGAMSTAAWMEGRVTVVA